MAKQLLEPVLNSGIQNTNFVNNRILTAEDLQTDQAANRQQHQQLGAAIGDGVVEGLDVSVVTSGAQGETPVLAITAGLALNRTGQALALAADTQVALSGSPPISPSDAGLFSNCSLPATSQALTGVFVLAVSPASGYQGLAPVQNLVPSSSTPPCVSQYKVEGVTFRLLALPLPAALAANLGDPNTLRNRLAHLCYGTADLVAFTHDPFDFPTTYGALDLLRKSDPSRADLLTNCDVPLALLYWSNSGIQFCDTWAVRRRPVPPPLASHWTLHVGQRRFAEAEAMLLQFQTQLAAIQQATANPAAVAAESQFAYLPAGGYLPVGAGEFQRDVFFDRFTVTRYHVDPARLRHLIFQSFLLDAIDLAAPPPLNVYESVPADGYLVFLRGDQTSLIPPPPATVNVTVILQLPESAINITGVDLHEIIDVYAEHGAGPQLKATYVSHADQRYLFQITLPANTYTVTAAPAAAFVNYWSPDSTQTTLASGQTASITLTLRYRFSKASRVVQPSYTFDGSRLAPGWYQKQAVIAEQVNWPWPPDPVWSARAPLDTLPPDVLQWYQDWAATIGAHNPNAPIDPTGIQVYVDSAHNPEQVAQSPYAYLVFGLAGAYVPLALLPTNASLDRSVSVSKGNLPGVDSETAGQLAQTGIHELDTLAAASADIVGQALNIGPEASAALIQNARETVSSLRDGLQIFNGVDANLESALKNSALINSAYDLANTEPRTLVSKLDSDTVNLAFAQRLVDEARQVVPSDAWSLSAPELGLKASDIAALNTQGITTQGELNLRGSTDAGKAALSRLAGIPLDSITLLVGAIGRAATRLTVARASSAPVTSVSGVNGDIGTGLAKAGFATIGTLSSATPAAIAHLFGGDTARASDVINAAKAAVE